MQAFTDEKVNDPHIKEFYKKITVIPSDDVSELQAKVEIESDSGIVFSCNYDIMKEIPSYGTKEGKIKAKFMDLSGPVVGEKKAGEVMSLILSLDGLEDVGKLTSLM